MRYLVLSYRIIASLVVAVFCGVHLGSALELNLRYALGDNRFESVLGVDDARKLHELTGKWCRATATEQHWNMFSNVGASSDVPLIVLVRKNKTRTLLHSELEPAQVNLPPGADYLSSGLSDEERELAWGYNFGNGRMRKMEDNVLSGPEGWSSARFTYLRWRLKAYFASSGEKPEDFVRIDLFRLRVQHPDLDGPPRLGGATWVMQYDAHMDSLWR